jgi:hypothetical protein
MQRGQLLAGSLGVLAVVAAIAAGAVGVPGDGGGEAHAVSLEETRLAVNRTLDPTAERYRYDATVRLDGAGKKRYPTVEGVRLSLLDRSGRTVGSGKVRALSPANDTVRTTLEAPIRPVAIVVRPTIVRLGPETVRSPDDFKAGDSCGPYEASAGIPVPNRSETPDGVGEPAITVCDKDT